LLYDGAQGVAGGGYGFEIGADLGELVVIRELLGHDHIGVTATVYAHVRLLLQRDAIDSLSTALGSPETAETSRSDSDEPPPCAALVR
jgi:hypothetical protein